MTYASIKFHHPPLLEDPPQIFRSPRRSLTAPFPISVPSLHSSNDSGFGNEGTHTQNSPTPSSDLQTAVENETVEKEPR